MINVSLLPLNEGLLKYNNNVNVRNNILVTKDL